MLPRSAFNEYISALKNGYKDDSKECTRIRDRGRLISGLADSHSSKYAREAINAAIYSAGVYVRFDREMHKAYPDGNMNRYTRNNLDRAMEQASAAIRVARKTIRDDDYLYESIDRDDSDSAKEYLAEVLADYREILNYLRYTLLDTGDHIAMKIVKREQDQLSSIMSSGFDGLLKATMNQSKIREKPVHVSDSADSRRNKQGESHVLRDYDIKSDSNRKRIHNN